MSYVPLFLEEKVINKMFDALGKHQIFIIFGRHIHFNAGLNFETPTSFTSCNISHLVLGKLAKMFVML